MRTITFYTHATLMDNHVITSMQIKDVDFGDVHTTQFHLLSFDLLEVFDKIFLNVGGEQYELGLGNTNTWTYKDLRLDHNLLKIVTAHFLVDL